ncbi:MAG: tRNA methyltransferase, partial [Candidatus Aenigmarchaeota archaeon ex4484_224]
MEIKIPQSFEQKFSKLLGNEYSNFISVLYVKPRKSIRVNTIKISKNELIKRLKKKGLKLKQVPWYELGFWVENYPEVDPAKSLEFFLGYFYIQEASSMIPPLVLDPKKNEYILDMCAAPGSKTTQMAQMMENQGIILALDDSLKRLQALRVNIQRLGIKNVVVALIDARKFWKKGIKFEKILLDVPCSASGTIISTYSVLNTWSPGLVKKLSKLQKQLIISAYKSLENDGILVYSTCSIDPEENEEVIDFAIRKLGMEVVGTKIRNLRYRE